MTGDSKYEEAVLGCILKNKKLAIHLANLDETFFIDKNCRDIFIAMKKLLANREVVDLVSIYKNLNQFTNVSIEYLQSITEPVILKHFNFYLQKITEERNRRLVLSQLQDVTNSLSSGEEIDISTEFSKIIKSTSMSSKPRAMMISDIIAMNLEEQKRLIENREKMYIPTGYDDIDNLICGLQKGDLVVIAGRPATGKSTFVTNMGLRISKGSSEPVLLYSLEMGENKVGYRVTSLLSAENSKKVRDGSWYSQSSKGYEQAIEQSRKFNFRVDGNPGNPFEKIRSDMIQYKYEFGLKAVIIDYLQLINYQRKKFSDLRTKITELTRDLKVLAMELEVPIIILSQMSRDIEKDKKRVRPELADLRDSGSIEQDADIVMFLYYMNDEEKEKREGTSLVQLYVAKCRDGNVGEVTLAYTKSQNRFGQYRPNK